MPGFTPEKLLDISGGDRCPVGDATSCEKVCQGCDISQSGLYRGVFEPAATDQDGSSARTQEIVGESRRGWAQ